MMTLQALLIANFDETFLLAMEQELEGRFRLRLCRWGWETLALLRREPIDLVLLDLTLPEVDGLTVLEMAMDEGIRPAVIAIGPLLTDYVIDRAQRLEICYLMRTPCSCEALSQRLLDLADSLRAAGKTRDSGDFVTAALRDLGLNPRHDGFAYLHDAIVRFSENPNQSFTKELYPAVGKPHNRSGSLVERSMRSAMDHGWQSDRQSAWLRRFPAWNKRPTAAVFIQQLARELTQWKEEAPGKPQKPHP